MVGVRRMVPSSADGAARDERGLVADHMHEIAVVPEQRQVAILQLVSLLLALQPAVASVQRCGLAVDVLNEMYELVKQDRAVDEVGFRRQVLVEKDPFFG